MISKQQANSLAYPLIAILNQFYEDPKNRREFEKWLQSRTKNLEMISKTDSV